MRLPGPVLAVLSCLVLAGCVGGAAQGGPEAAGEADGTPRPIRFAAGEDAGTAPWATGFQLHDQATRFSVHLGGVEGARVDLSSLVLLENVDAAPREIFLQAAPYLSPLVLEAALVFHDELGSPACVLDLKAAEPACKTRLGPGKTLRGAWTLRLSEGAGANDLPARDVALSIGG